MLHIEASGRWIVCFFRLVSYLHNRLSWFCLLCTVSFFITFPHTGVEGLLRKRTGYKLGRFSFYPLLKEHNTFIVVAPGRRALHHQVTSILQFSNFTAGFPPVFHFLHKTALAFWCKKYIFLIVLLLLMSTFSGHV